MEWHGKWPFDFTWRFDQHWCQAADWRAKASVVLIHFAAWCVQIPVAIILFLVLTAPFVGPMYVLAILEAMQ
jgi:hypothetical protein